MSSETDAWPFAREDVVAVAEERAIEPADLESVVAAHQDRMAELPGVENLVYEWRRQFDATVLARSDAAYFVAAPEWAWEEFGDDLEISEAERDALAALHRRTVVDRADVSDAADDLAAPMVLVRSRDE